MWHVISQFFVLSTAPRELWILFLLKLLESFAHFSLSYVLVLYLSEEFGYSDQSAGWVYGFFGMLISIYGVLVGFLIDRLGVRSRGESTTCAYGGERPWKLLRNSPPLA